ncbi:uncharacterized protein LOC111864987 isoform X3 [Cryptotermes secundus]|uniref:uncharacterized protein LOC111864987 isoform X3 n=1 Tax=Cryptotermes secundus TaxID=105785 RepID=UPI000CD7AEE4|nr:uncharacterized protein LOC111864987 isoform X3 [Cryptotermes secundus]
MVFLRPSRQMPGRSHDMFESEDFMSQVDKNSDASPMEQNELNLRFIQAMIQLKSVVNTCSYISATELQNILLAVHTDDSKETDELHTDCGHESLISHRSRNQQNTAIHNFPHSEIGFGFGTNRDCNVSGGILKYLMCSSGANHLLVRSVEAVLQYLSQSIQTEKSESLDLIFQSWKGSVLEYSLNVVHQLVDHFAQQGEEQNECREVCFTFIRNVIDGILNADSPNMHPVWTQQCCIMVEMGNSKHLCTDFLNYLTDKMQNISRNLKPKAASANNVESEDSFGHKPGDIEKSFYLFYMTEKLLKKWKTFQSSNRSVNKNDTSQVYGANILELWRQNWSLPKSNANSSGRNDSIEQNPASKWKDVLEELVINFTEDYPFITLYAFQCLELLQQES